MTALTSDRDTVRRNGDEFEFEAASTVYAGSMVCLNADGKLVPASVTAGLSPVVGVAQRLGRTGEKVPVRRGVFAFAAVSDYGACLRLHDKPACRLSEGSPCSRPVRFIYRNVEGRRHRNRRGDGD